jgi:putative phosphoesterase
MRIGVLADSHDNVPLIRKALALLNERGAQAIIHAGDVVAPFAAKALKEFSGPVYAVYGNNDGERAGLARVLDIVDGPRELSIGGRRILVAHEVPQIPAGISDAADVIITAHTHSPEIAPGSPVRINPGEVGGWLHGRSTCAVVELDSLQGEICDL